VPFCAYEFLGESLEVVGSKLACLTSHSLNTLSDLFSNGETLSALISSILRDLSDADRIQQPETVEPIHIIQKP
jgi:hypothetical protein